MTFVILAACGPADPWSGAPTLAEPERTEWWSLSIAGRPVGWEERRFGPGREVVRRRALRLASGADERWVRSASHVRCDDEACDWVLWSDGGGERAGRGQFDVPDVWTPTAPGPIRVLSEDLATIVDSEVSIEEDPPAVRWTTPYADVVTQRGADGHPLVTAGRFVARRTDHRSPDPEPVDVARVLAVPAPAFPEARRSHVGVFDVGGVQRVIERPTWPELPAPERERVRDLVVRVADDVQDAWVPGRGGAAGRGDCTEHALALVHAARSAGFDARTVAGRVYAEGPDGPALVLHAWAEIRLGGRWVAADAALRQFPADASHLPLGAWVADVVARDGAVALRSLR